MKQYIILSAACLALSCAEQKTENKETAPLKMIEQIDFSHVKIQDNF